MCDTTPYLDSIDGDCIYVRTSPSPTPAPTPGPSPPTPQWKFLGAESCYGHTLGVNYDSFPEAKQKCTTAGTSCSGIYNHKCHDPQADPEAYFAMCDTAPTSKPQMGAA